MFIFEFAKILQCYLPQVESSFWVPTAFSTSRTDCCDMTEKLLKVVLNPHQTKKSANINLSQILIFSKNLDQDRKTYFLVNFKYILKQIFWLIIENHPDHVFLEQMDRVLDLCVALWGRLPQFLDSGKWFVSRLVCALCGRLSQFLDT